MRMWIPAGVVLIAVLICVWSIPYRQHIEVTSEARTCIQLPSEAYVVSARRIPAFGPVTDVVFRLPRTRSVDTWLNYVCEHNPSIPEGATWIAKHKYVRASSCCGGTITLSYDQRRDVFEFYNGDQNCSCN